MLALSSTFKVREAYDSTGSASIFALYHQGENIPAQAAKSCLPGAPGGVPHLLARNGHP
jgi:hypothetical protein